MASVADLVEPQTLERLAAPEDLRAGAALANAGAVHLAASGPLSVVATVTSDEQAAHVELRGGSVLAFECSCDVGRAGGFCAHLAAVAIETWRRAPARRAPRPPAEPSRPVAPAEVAAVSGPHAGPPAAPSTPSVPGAPAGKGPQGPPLKVGVQLPEVEREVRWPELRDMARAAEDAGFDSIWVGDHLLYRRPRDRTRGPWEAWTMLAGLAEATQRVALGPLVACTSFHNPAMLAKMAATVDEISGGRLILGLGAGWNETEFRAFGYPFDRRVARFEEAFTIIRRLLREGSIDYAGEFYEARDCEILPRGPRPGGPPLLIGSVGPRMLRATLPYVDAWNAWYDATGNHPSGVPALRAQVDELCRDVGRDPGAVERTVAVLVRLPGAVGRVHGDVDAPQVSPLKGSTAQMADALRAYAREGISHVQLVLDPITRASIEAMGRVVVALAAA